MIIISVHLGQIDNLMHDHYVHLGQTANTKIWLKL